MSKSIAFSNRETPIWTLSEVSPQALVKVSDMLSSVITKDGTVPAINFSVLQFSILLNYESITAVFRQASAKSPVVGLEEEDYPYGVGSKLDWVQYGQKDNYFKYLSTESIDSLSAEYLLKVPNVSRSSYHTLKLECHSFELMTFLVSGKYNEHYEALMSNYRTGIYLNDMQDIWLTKISDRLAELLSSDRLTNIKDDIGVTDSQLQHLFKNPYIWRN